MNYPLFETATALARSNDPDTSKEAAREFVTSGGLAASEQLAYQLIANHPGRTAKELEELRGLERCTVTRRVTGLIREGVGGQRRTQKTRERSQRCDPVYQNGISSKDKYKCKYMNSTPIRKLWNLHTTTKVTKPWSKSKANTD